jgi:integrase
MSSIFFFLDITPVPCENRLPSVPATHAPLFRSNRGSQLTYGALLYQWTKLCRDLDLVDAAGEPRYTSHQLRHTRGSELVEQGQSLDIVQSILGHRDPRSTQVYADRMPIRCDR